MRARPQTPALAADAIIELVDLPGKPIVLIERKNPPPGWAIPGGFVDIGESGDLLAEQPEGMGPLTLLA